MFEKQSLNNSIKLFSNKVWKFKKDSYLCNPNGNEGFNIARMLRIKKQKSTDRRVSTIYRPSEMRRR